MSMKREKFMIIPFDIDADPRLQRWLSLKGVNDREVIWVVERMIARLALRQDKPYRLQDLLEGLHRRHLSYPVLKEIVTTSGFFEYEDGYVWYNWERFSQAPVPTPRKNSVGDNSNAGRLTADEKCSQSAPNVRSECSPTPACDLKATDVDIDVDIDVDVDNYHTKKEKEKNCEEAAVPDTPKAQSADGYEARIHEIVQNYPFREGELAGWGGKTDERNRAELEKHLIRLLDDKNSSLAHKIGRYLKLKDYRERWREIVMAFVGQLDGTGTMSKLANVSEVRHYFFALAKQNNPKSHAYQAGLSMVEELEDNRQAWVAEEKKRFPFEDYDPERGTRYVGNRLIPWDAPPRPDNRTVWDEDDNKWVDPEVLDARRAAGFARLEAMMAEMPLMTSSRLIKETL